MVHAERRWSSARVIGARELQLETARRVPQWRTLLLDERASCAGRTLARLLQHRQTAPLAGLQAADMAEFN